MAALVPSAGARSLQPRPWLAVSDGASGNKTTAVAPSEGRADPTGLPAAQEHLDLVGELNPQHFGGVREGEIADLAVHKGFAYLNSWDSDVDCTRGGVYVVDIHDPANPKEVSYIPPIQPFYHGEGAHAISVDTPQFKGDLLAVNDEAWGANRPNSCGPADATSGGFDLYDVSDPVHPKVLVQGAGDRDGGDGPLGEQETTLANSFHSVFVWQAGPRAYLVASDNIEFTDVDVFDITDPKNPVQVGDYDLLDMFPQVADNEKANGGAIFNHDMVVKKVGSRFHMIVSYWDAGYVTLDVTDPAHPSHVVDTTFGMDAFRPALTEEGNAHESELSSDNQFLLAANEDFQTARSTVTGSVTGKTGVAAEAGDNPERINDLPDGKMNGPSTWVGDACAPVVAAPADDGDPNTDRIALIERGSCDFVVKLDNAANAGYDGAVVFNQVRPDDGLVNMVTDNGPPVVPAVQMRRVDALGPNGALSSATSAPPAGTAGPTVTVENQFDGWGYGELYDANTGELLDSYAIPESEDPRYEFGFGDFSIHEFATDPTEPLAYAAWYGGGMRVFSFSRADGLVPRGKFIDDDGNGSNFWGVEQFTGSDGQRYIAGADRDFGLQIFRYTGTGAAQRPSCSDVSATTAFETPIALPLTCADANDNALTLKIATQPSHGTLGTIVHGQIAYTPNNGFSGTDTFAYAANDGAADSAPATASVKVSEFKYEVPPYSIRKRPGLTAKVRPRRDRKKPFRFRVFGRLKLPGGVSTADGCTGNIRVTARKGGKRMARRTVALKPTCAYSARITLHGAPKRGKARLTISFRGNTSLLRKNIKRTARFGKTR